MEDNLFTILLGVGLMALGYKVIVNPRFYDPIYNFYFDFTDYNISFGIALIVIGIIFIWTIFRKKKK